MWMETEILDGIGAVIAMRPLTIILFCTLLSGCVAQNADDLYKQRTAQRLKTQPPAVVKPPVYEPTLYERKFTFDPEEHAPYMTKGTGSVSGEAFLKTAGGDVRYAAGEPILLIPATLYGREFFLVDILKSQELVSPALDHRMPQAVRTVRADSKGRFTFTDLPMGTYVLYTSIYWQVPHYSKYSGSSMEKTGAQIWQDVTVSSDRNEAVILTR